MIPRTFPSSVAPINGATQMIVYFLPSVTGLTRWVDYIPVQYSTVNTSTTENTYNQDGYIPVTSLSSITGMTPFKEYVPVYVDTAATDVWKVNITGFIPVGTAGIGGSALSLNFTGMSTLDSRITFSRASNATLTDSNGLIQYAPHNLLTYSEQFDNAAWVKTTAGDTITANAVVAPDGTTTADKLTPDTTSTGGHRVYQSVSTSSTSTLSFYAKAAGYSHAFVTASGANWVYFDLSAGTVESSLGTGWTAATITDAGNGWYRCTATTSTANTAYYIGVYNAVATNGNSAPTFAGDGTSGIYIWGAQLNVGALQPYNHTTVKNLLGYTQEFDNAAWTKSNATVTANATTAPDGSVSADKLVETTAVTVAHTVQQTITVVTNTPQLISVYAKAGERSKFQLGGGNSFATFDLNLGTVTLSVGASATIVSVGNGWYRCSIAGAVPSVTSLIYGITLVNDAGSNNYTGDGTSGIYIWGAQLSDSASVDPYVYNPVAAPSAAAYYGPRFDYDPITLAPKGLLIEEQRTNLLTYSEQFDNAIWTKDGVTVVSNTTIAPDGTQTADLLVATAVNGVHRIYQGVAQTSGVTYTLVVYAKAAGYTNLYVEPRNNAGTSTPATFNLSNGTVSGGVNASIVYVGNGWYRCACGVTANATGSGTQIFNVSTSSSYTGDGYSGIYIWGAQFEAGAFATSYIPTVASQVTRAADTAIMQGANFSNWYNQSAGTMYAEVGYMLGSTYGPVGDYYLAASDGTSSNVLLMADVSGLVCQSIANGTQTYNQNVGSRPSSSTTKKQAFAYATNNANQASGGTLGTTDTTVTLPGVNQMTLGKRWDTAGYLNGHIQRIAYYNRRLANSELQAITT